MQTIFLVQMFNESDLVVRTLILIFEFVACWFRDHISRDFDSIFTMIQSK